MATTTFNQNDNHDDISEEFDPNKFKRKLEHISQNFQKHMKNNENNMQDYVNQSIVKDRDMLQSAILKSSQ